MFQLFHGRGDRHQEREVAELLACMRQRSRGDALSYERPEATLHYGEMIAPADARTLTVWSAALEGLTNRTPAMRMELNDAIHLLQSVDETVPYDDSLVTTLFLCLQVRVYRQ